MHAHGSLTSPRSSHNFPQPHFRIYHQAFSEGSGAGHAAPELDKVLEVAFQVRMEARKEAKGVSCMWGAARGQPNPPTAKPKTATKTTPNNPPAECRRPPQKKHATNHPI